jgi:nucleoside 2-deoxyribosyltransferase
MPKIYIANGLFSEADYNYNELIADELISMGYDIYLPQRNEAINDKTTSANSVQIYDGDGAELDSSDILIAVLDGPVIDPGVAAEVGYFAAKGKTIYGLLTDSRESSKTFVESKVEALKHPAENQFNYANLFVIGAIKKNGKVFLSRRELMDHLK